MKCNFARSLSLMLEEEQVKRLSIVSDIGYELEGLDSPRSSRGNGLSLLGSQDNLRHQHEKQRNRIMKQQVEQVIKRHGNVFKQDESSGRQSQVP